MLCCIPLSLNSHHTHFCLQEWRHILVFVLGPVLKITHAVAQFACGLINDWCVIPVDTGCYAHGAYLDYMYSVSTLSFSL